MQVVHLTLTVFEETDLFRELRHVAGKRTGITIGKASELMK